MLKRKLLKHVLPILLSVSMVFGSTPTVAYAAEHMEGEIMEAAVLEESEAADEETVFVQETEPDNTADANKVETEATTQPETEHTAGSVEVNADAQPAALDTKIIIEEDFLREYTNSGYLQYDVDKNVVIAKYDEAESNIFGDLKSELENIGDSEAISIEVDGTIIDVPKESLNFQWMKKSDDSYVEMPGEVPSAPNDYKFVISLSAIDGVCQAATAELGFTIAKRQLSFGLDPVLSVKPGTTVDKFLTDLKENYCLLKENRNWGERPSEMPEAAKDIYIASIEAEVYDAHDTANTMLSKETVLVESGDYTVVVKASLNEAAASTYELAETGAVNIKIQDLIETKVKVEQKNAGEIISKVYREDTPISYETEIKDKINLSIVIPDENGDETKDTVVEGAQAMLVWCDADKNELGLDPEAAPTDAGIYYLDFQFIPAEEQQEIYQASKENYITIVIKPAPLTLKVSELTGEYFTGMTEEAVLKDAEYILVDEAEAEFSFQESDFWGISYNNPNYTQSYEPVFKLIKAEKEKDGIREEWTDNAGSVLNASKYVYRLAFTGKKAIYTADGTKTDERDVNGEEVNTADKNHCIVTTAKTLFDTSVEVPVKEGIVTKIDASAILEEGVNATKDFNDLYKPTHFASKVYDGSGLYENRGAYKKAVVILENGTSVASNYEDTLTYTWYRIHSKTEARDAETGKQTGWVEAQSVKQTSNAIPTAAGDYKLVISFSDLENGYAPCTETLYYRIDRQLLVVSPMSIPVAHKGETISAYIDRLSYEEEHNLYIVPDNQYTEGLKTEDNLLTDWKQIDKKYWNDYTNCYDLAWYVERLERNDDGNPIYKKLTSNDSFQLSDENYYRLGVELTCQNSNYSNYAIIYHADLEKEDFAEEYRFYNDNADLTVKEIGSIELEIEIDETKLASTVKDYDAKPFYAAKEEAYADVLKAVTVKKKTDGEVLTPMPILSYSIYDAELDQYIYDFEDMVDAGAYRLELSFSGDETYAPCEAEKAIEYTIKALELKAAPYVYDNITAGTYVYANSTENDGEIFNSTMTAFTCEKMPEEDKSAFEWKSNLHTYMDENGALRTMYYNGYAAYFEGGFLSFGEYHDLFGTVRKAGKADAYEGYIRYNTNYTVQLSGELAYPYSRNYNIKYVKTPFQAAFRGPSAVYAYDTNNTSTISTQWNYEEIATTITPLKGIPYVSNGKTTDLDGNEIKLEGNYLEFQIAAPEEFKENTGDYQTYFDNFVYQNSIEKDAKGYVIDTDSGNGLISILIPADEKAVKSFEIIWENGYIETFNIDYTNAVFLDDLTKAAAPKSLSFNGVNTKMAVGGEQQLDVKIKKAQINDIIYLDYRVLEGQDVISVTSDDGKKTAGCVTALKVGTATVAAVPVRMENGEKKDLENAKAATIKITVSDVSAPAIKKITAIDNQAAIAYVKPSDGYRREVYVLAGKQTEEDFKNAIQSMNNENRKGIFAIAPKYYTTANENDQIIDVKKQLLSIELSGLKAGTEYTVYIRNVSGVRTLHDGAFVTESINGTIKTFKTTLPQVKGLNAYFKQAADYDNTEDAEPQMVSRKEAALTQKTEQLYVSGKFRQKPEYEAADDIDYLWLELPFDTKQHKGYVVPKLTYWLSADEDEIPVEEIRDFRNYIYIEGRYYRKADIATIDKKGKITLKGTGTVYVHVKDPETKVESVAELYIYANADHVSGKGGKLAVGQGIYLSSLLTYAVGQTTIAGYDKQDLSIPEESLRAINEEGSFSIVPTGDGDYYITALKPKMTCEFAVTDQLVALLGGNASITMKLQSTPIEAVKNMKITDIVDNGFVINFAYTAQADHETMHTGVHLQYRIDITDARKSVVDSFVVDCDTFGYFYKELNLFNADITHAASNYDGKKKMFYYRYPYSSKKIARLSSYNISVTPIYGDDFSAKPAVKKINTTNFPASYQGLAENEYGGETIDVISYAGGILNKNFTLRNNRYLTSGNTYTLRLTDQFTNSVQISKDRMTDSLTWKSLNTKVATVKANAGAYTASLNAVKAGITIIEVSSKITKKVIARYPVFVKAAGNAKDDYYGDYEYIGEYLYQLDPFYNSNIEILTEANPVRVTDEDLENVTIYDWQYKKYRAENYKWVQFTAPKFGEYEFKVTSSVSRIVDGNGVEYSTTKRNFTIFEGQTYYFKVSGTFEMTVKGTKMNGSLTTTDSVDISNSDVQYIEFRAAEDNYYTFYTKNGDHNGINKIGKLNEKTQSFEAISGVATSYDEDGIARKSVGLHAGDVIYLQMKEGNYSLYAEKRAVIALSESTAHTLSIKADGEQWYTFTALVAGDYTFKSTEATAVINMDSYKDLMDADGESNIGSHYGADAKDVTYTIQMKEKQKAVLRIYAAADQAADTEAAITASISVSAEVPDAIEVNGTKTLTIPEGSAKWVSVKFTEAGRYTFRAIPTEPDASYNVTLKFYKNALNAGISINADDIVVSDQYEADAKIGDTIYVKVETDKTGTETSATANVQISLTKAAVTTLTAGTLSPLTVENGREYWYAFIAPSYGTYTFRSVVTENAAENTHRLTAYKYESMEKKQYDERLNTTSYDFNKNYVLEAGEEVALKVASTDTLYAEDGTSPVTTNAQVRVEKLEATAFTVEDPANISLEKGDIKWCSFTARQDITYTFTKIVAAGSATVEMYRALNDTGGRIGMIADSMDYALREGETVYFKVTQTGADAAALTLTAYAPVIETVPDTPASFTKTEKKYYEYTAAKAGRYAISYTATPAEADITVLYGMGSFENATDSINHGYAEIDSVAAGAKIYIKVSTTSETEVSINLKVEQIVPIALDAGAPVPITVEPYRNSWYFFTAAEAGRYMFDKTDEENNSTNITYYKDITNTSPIVGNNPTETYFKTGETVYMKLSTTKTEQQTTSVKVEKITPTQITAEPMSVTIKPGETKYYIFTAEEKATYQFDASKTVQSETEETDTVKPDVSVYRYLNTENIKRVYTWRNMIGLKNTESVMFVFQLPSTAEQEETFMLTCKNVDTEMEWIEGADLPKEVTINNGEKILIAFEAPEDGIFAFSTEGVTDVRITPVIYYDEEKTKKGFYHTNLLQAGEVAKYYVGYEYNTASDESGAEVTAPESVTFSIKVSRVVPEELSLDTPVDVTLSRYEWKLFRFKAPEDGRYSFRMSNPDLEGKWRKCTYSLTSGLGYNSYDLKLPIVNNAIKTKDGYFTFAIYYEKGQNASESFQFSVEQLIPEVMTGTIKVTLAPQEVRWYEYTAQKTGTYHLDVSNNLVHIYPRLMGSPSAWSAVADISRTAGEKTYFSIENTSDKTKTTTITIKLVEEPSAVPELGESVPVSFNKSLKGAWMAFTAPEDGFYHFNVENGSGNSVEAVYMPVAFAVITALSENFGEETFCDPKSSAEGTAAFENKLIAKGDTVYMYIKKPQKETDVISITVTKNEERTAKIVKLHTDGEMEVTVEKGEENAVWYAFYAPKAETYWIRIDAPKSDQEEAEKYRLIGNRYPNKGEEAESTLAGGGWRSYSFQASQVNQVGYVYIEKLSGVPGKKLTITISEQTY